VNPASCKSFIVSLLYSQFRASSHFIQDFLIPLLLDDSHNIRSTLRPSRLSRLQNPSQLGRKHLKYPSIGVLIDERPVKVEDYQFTAHLLVCIYSGFVADRSWEARLAHGRLFSISRNERAWMSSRIYLPLEGARLISFGRDPKCGPELDLICHTVHTYGSADIPALI
jgi:hypothetical protein